MTREERISWLSQMFGVIGVLLWIGFTLYFNLYSITIVIVVIAVPATIYNIVYKASSAMPTMYG